MTDKLYVGGRFLIVDSIYTGNMTMFDGKRHVALVDSSSGMNYCWNGGCEGVASIMRYRDQIIASRMRSSTYDAVPQIVGIGGWDGKKWRSLKGGIASRYYETLGGFWSPSTAYDFCLENDTLYAGGYFVFADSILANGLASWDGTKWHTYNVPLPAPTNGVLATSVSKYKGSIYLGGNFFLNIDGQEVNDLIRYDGSKWHGCGMVDGWTNIHDLEVFQDKLYVAGYFKQTEGPAAGNAGNSIMSWDGEKWDDLGGGVCSPFGAIDDLFVHEDKLYVAGGFECIGGIETYNIATWDGQRWCSVGRSEFNRAIHAVAVWRDTIYVGGSFFEIDGQPAHYFARYVGDHATDTCSAPVVSAPERPGGRPALALRPNPVSEVLRVTLPQAAAALRVYDLAGRDVSGKTGNLNVGEVQNLADVTEAVLEVAALPPGWYLLQVVFRDGSSAAAGFVKM
ncbi:MAG: T9SS type A sorting domain-containing protein [Saprospiraceae bacterium]|nr:T9SS type A sorting domain-containing protein [Saprospiraceae bacterium]